MNYVQNCNPFGSWPFSTLIAAQSLVIATTATEQTGKDADLFRALFKHSILLAALVGLPVLGYVYLFPMLVPGP